MRKYSLKTQLSRLLFIGLAFTGTTHSNDLLNVYQLALQNDPDLKIAYANFQANKQQAAINRAGIKPSISAAYQYQRNDNDKVKSQFPFAGATGITISGSDVTSVETSNDWSVSLSQSLFNASKWYTAQQGKHLGKQAKLQLDLDEQNTILRVSRAYFQVLRAQNNVDAALAQQEADKWQLDQAKNRFEYGSIAITDVHQAQAAYDLSTALLLTEQAALDNTKRALRIITGTNTANLAKLKPGFEAKIPTPANSEQWLSQAQANNLSILLAKTNMQASKAQARAAKASHLPTVEAQLAYFDNNTDTDIPQLETYTNARNGSQVSINVSIPLYLGGELNARRRQSKALYQQSIETHKGAISRIKQQTLNAYNTVTVDTARIKARAQAVTSAQSAADSIEAGYEAGSYSIIDVLSAKRNFFSALRDYNNSKLDYILHVFELKQLAGTLNINDVKQVNNALTPG